MISEATLRWEHWRRTRWLRRSLASWGGTMLAGAAVIGLLAWGGFSVFNVGEQGESIAVKLGNPDGEDLPLTVQSVPDQAMQAVMTAQRELAATTVVETRDVAVRPAPANPSKPETKQSPAPTPSVPAPATEKQQVIRGEENGNASELVLRPQGDKVSQNQTWPAYLFMPLPQKLDAGLLARVKPTTLYTALERRDLLLQYYDAATLKLKVDPELPVRPALWVILKDAGYDLSNAEYKRGRDLRPVVLTAQVGLPGADGKSVAPSEVKLVQSSGAADVDEAVVYAFRLSGFANGTGQAVEARYTYDFSAGK